GHLRGDHRGRNARRILHRKVGRHPRDAYSGRAVRHVSMKSTVTCLLILTRVGPGEARERTPLEQVKKIKPGTWVVVTLQDNTTLKGRLGQVAQDRFILEPLVPGSWPSRELLFQDVRKIGSKKK